MKWVCVFCGKVVKVDNKEPKDATAGDVCFSCQSAKKALQGKNGKQG